MLCVYHFKRCSQDHHVRSSSKIWFTRDQICYNTTCNLFLLWRRTSNYMPRYVAIFSKFILLYPSLPVIMVLVTSWQHAPFFTICAYALQGFAFDHISLCICVYVYMWQKKLVVWGLTTWKSLVGAMYCSLIKLNRQKGAYYARWFIQRKKFGGILLTGQERFLENCIMVSHALYTCNAAHYAMFYCNCSADLIYRYR